MSAAGRPLIGLLPQGSAKSDFSKGAGSGFDLGGFVTDAFARLTADKAWDAGGGPAGAPPTPGRVTLSGHSGADQPITQMLSGGQAGDLAGLFLFDTMYVNDAEKKRKPKAPTPANWPLKLEGKVEAYVKARFDADLAAVRAAPAADRRAWVERRGFRLSVVHAQGSPRYTESSERLRTVVEGWIAALDPAVVGADAIAAIRRNYVFKTAAKGKGHMQVMGDGNFAGAIAMLPLSAVTGAKQTPPASGTGVQRAAALLPAAGNRATAGVLGRAAVAPSGPVACPARRDHRRPRRRVRRLQRQGRDRGRAGGLQGHPPALRHHVRVDHQGERVLRRRETGGVPRPEADRPREHPRREAAQGRAGADRQGLARRRRLPRSAAPAGSTSAATATPGASSATTASAGPSTSTPPSTPTCRSASPAVR